MIERIDPSEAARRVREGGFVYVDVRSVPEFEKGHPEGAYNVPLMHLGASGMEPNPDFLPVFEASFAKETPVVLGCRSGGRSLRAAEMLAAVGFHVVDQRAGFSGNGSEPGWAGAGLPVGKVAADGRSYQALSSRMRGAR